MQLNDRLMKKTWNDKKTDLFSLACRVLKYDIENEGIYELLQAIDILGANDVMLLNDIISSVHSYTVDVIEKELVMNSLHTKLFVSPPLEKIFKEMDMTDYSGKINFIDVAVDDALKISYIPDDRLNRFDDVWNKDERKTNAFMGKPGKVFKKLFPNASPSEVSKFVDEFTAEFKDDYELFLSDDVCKYYLEEEYYYNCSGSLGSSCMKYDNINHYMQFYEDEGVQILVLTRDGKVWGRALVWEGVSFSYTDVTTFMDRVYLHDDKDLLIFKKFAKKQGWVFKEHQSYDYKATFVLGDDYFEDEVTYSLKKDLFDHKNYPYFDTFSYATRDTLYNRGYKDYTLMNTDGRLGNDDRVYCDDIDERLTSDEAVYCNYHDCYYSLENAVQVIGGDWFLETDTIYSEYLQGHILERDVRSLNDGEDAIYDGYDVYRDDNLCIIYEDVYTVEYAKDKGYRYSALYDEWIDDALWSEFHDSYIYEERAVECEVVGGVVDKHQCLYINLNTKLVYVPKDYVRNSGIVKAGDEYFTEQYLEEQSNCDTLSCKNIEAVAL